MSELAVYLGLFLAAFLAATLLPAQSEALLVGLLLTQKYNPWLLIFIASLGNVLGSAFNWLLGYGIHKFKDKKWFPIKADKLERATAWYRKYGRWSLLLCWVPIIGDPLTVAAGILRERFVVFLILVTLAKTGRYLILAGVTLRFFGN